jgi:hypothetical protein
VSRLDVACTYILLGLGSLVAYTTSSGCDAVPTCTNLKAGQRVGLYLRSSKAMSRILILWMEVFKHRCKILFVQSCRSLQTVPIKHFHMNPLLFMSKEGATFQRLGSFSVPFVMPFSFGSVTSWNNEAFRPDPIPSSNE